MALCFCCLTCCIPLLWTIHNFVLVLKVFMRQNMNTKRFTIENLICNIIIKNKEKNRRKTCFAFFALVFPHLNINKISPLSIYMSVNVLASRPIVRPISQAETGQFRPKQANFSRLYSDNLKFACTGVLINFTVIFIQEDIKTRMNHP